MTRMLAAIIVLALLSPTLAGEPVVGSGVQAEETRQLAEFEEIDLRINGDLNVTIGEATPLTISGDDNILPLIKTEVRKGRLTISAEKSFDSEHGLKLAVTVPDLTFARVAGSGDMRISELDSEDLRVEVKGSGDIKFSGRAHRLAVSVEGSGDAHGSGLSTDEASASVQGSGDVKLTGRATRLTANVTGSGDVDASGLATDQASVAIQGSGDVRVDVAEALQVSIRGSGDVSYTGEPSVVQHIDGSGDVRRKR